MELFRADVFVHYGCYSIVVTPTSDNAILMMKLTVFNFLLHLPGVRDGVESARMVRWCVGILS